LYFLAHMRQESVESLTNSAMESFLSLRIVDGSMSPRLFMTAQQIVPTSISRKS
jgi:hypothetical protein